MKITKACAIAHSICGILIGIFAALFMLLLDGSFFQTWTCGIIAATIAGITKEFTDSVYEASFNLLELLLTIAGGIIGALFIALFVI
jgi:hypothetical protein